MCALYLFCYWNFNLLVNGRNFWVIERTPGSSPNSGCPNCFFMKPDFVRLLLFTHSNWVHRLVGLWNQPRVLAYLLNEFECWVLVCLRIIDCISSKSWTLCFRTLGTPTEETWPGVCQMPDYKPNFPCWKGSQLHTSLKNLDNLGMDLLQVGGTWIDQTRFFLILEEFLLCFTPPGAQFETKS